MEHVNEQLGKYVWTCESQSCGGSIKSISEGGTSRDDLGIFGKILVYQFGPHLFFFNRGGRRKETT